MAAACLSADARKASCASTTANAVARAMKSVAMGVAYLPADARVTRRTGTAAACLSATVHAIKPIAMDVV
jgi:hypothetical protein